MKVLLIELDYHAEVVLGICSHLSNSEISVSLVTTAEIANKIHVSEDVDQLYLHDKNLSVSSFFENKKILELAWDLILFTTAQSRFQELSKLKFKAPVAVMVHNIHSFFDRSKFKPRWSPFFIWKDLSFFIRIILLKRDFIYRKKFLDKVDFFLFPSQSMIDYAIENYTDLTSKIIQYPVVWVSKKEFEEKKEENLFRIAIIGTIDQRRRNYDQILELANFLKKNSKKTIKINLLGKPYGLYGRKILKEATAISSDKVQIKTYNDFVSFRELDETLKCVDLIIAPIVSRARHHLWEEYYGKTKISGNINNAIEYGKPILIPDFYPIEDDLKNTVRHYANPRELFNDVLNRIENKSELEIQTDLHYNQKDIKERLENMFKQLLERN